MESVDRDCIGGCILYIRENQTKAELLAQLAEECAELAQAALKVRRAWGYGTPTPIQPKEAEKVLFEEIADVRACIEVWDDTSPEEWDAMRAIQDEKTIRWAERIRREKGE